MRPDVPSEIRQQQWHLQHILQLTPCNAHCRDLAEHVKHGVYEAGGFPAESPVMPLGEAVLRPTSTLYRNLAGTDVEESIRAIPRWTRWCCSAAATRPRPPC